MQVEVVDIYRKAHSTNTQHWQNVAAGTHFIDFSALSSPLFFISVVHWWNAIRLRDAVISDIIGVSPLFVQHHQTVDLLCMIPHRPATSHRCVSLTVIKPLPTARNCCRAKVVDSCCNSSNIFRHILSNQNNHWQLSVKTVTSRFYILKKKTTADLENRGIFAKKFK